MLSRKILFAALTLALLASAALTFAPTPSRAQDRRTQLPPGPPPTIILESDAQVVTVCEGEPAPQVRLTATGRSPGGNEVRFTNWQTGPVPAAGASGGGRIQDIRVE